MRRLIITLLVLAALFVAVDRIADAVAEHEVAKRVRTAADLRTTPDVEVRGFPFLTQLASGHYPRVDVSVPRISRGGVALRRLTAHLRGVDAPLAGLLRGAADVRVDTVAAAVTIPYAVVAERTPGDLDLEPADGGLRFSGSLPIYGRRVPVDALVDVSVRDRSVELTPRRVELAGRPVGGAVAGRFGFSVPVGRLPFGLDLTGVRATARGLRVTASGHDLHVSGSP
ncbi:MAG: LmeA family phospholipid-binding protein [Streptosporangiaceae bacterium]